MTVPTCQRTGNVFRFDWPEAGIAAIVRRITTKDAYVRGEVTWLSTSPGTKGHLHQGLLSFNSSTAKTQLARAFSDRHPEKDWVAIIEQLAAITLREYRRGEPVVPLEPSPERAQPVPIVLTPFVYEGQPFTFFGEPGTLKSYLGLLLALIAATGHNSPDLPFRALSRLTPLILDWESSAADHAYRLSRLERGMGLSSGNRIFYRYCASPLADEIETIQERVLEHGINFLIVDSLAPAAGGDINSPQPAQDFFDALRTLKCSAVILAHTAKHNETGKRSIFGSQFFNARSRGVAEVLRYQEPGDDTVHLGIYHRKSNLSRLERPIGLRFTFYPPGLSTNANRVEVTAADVRATPELLEGMTLAERILDKLGQTGPNRAKDLAEMLAVTPSVVRATLSRLRASGKVVALEDGRYSLPEDSGVPF